MLRLLRGWVRQVDFNIPRDSGAGYVNNQREHYEYKFNGVIPPDAKQDEVRPTSLCCDWLRQVIEVTRGLEGLGSFEANAKRRKTQPMLRDQL
jgi:hypothetical protein